MKLGIHPTANSFSTRWIAYCEEKQIPYKLVNCYATDIVQQLQDCNALLWHHQQGSPKDIVFAKQLLFALEHAGIKVFPNFKTGWHFDDKLGQKYLLEAAGVEAIPSYIFFSKQDALEWVHATNFPKVFKLRGGAGSSNVELVKDSAAAIQLINKAFGKGFSKYQPMANLKERIRKYRTGKTTARDVLKGVARLIVPPAFSKIGGKEIGYAYFQDFIDNNDHDIRVIIVDGKAFAIKRLVRENDFRASGSGTILYDKNLFDETTIRAAFVAAKKLQTQVVAFDFVYQKKQPTGGRNKLWFFHGWLRSLPRLLGRTITMA